MKSSCCQAEIKAITSEVSICAQCFRQLSYAELHPAGKKQLHCYACHQNFDYDTATHQCTGIKGYTPCRQCNPEHGSKHCPMCGHLLA